MKYFGTDGIRSKAEMFTPEFLAKIIKGLINYAGDGIKVLIGGDTRESTEWILQDLSKALETFGIEYDNVGVLPTPAINYCFYQMGYDFAIDVTASHNPYTDNGIKIFERSANSGQKLSEHACEIIEQAIDEAQIPELISLTIHDDLHKDAIDLYKEHLLTYLGSTNLTKLHLGMDCANGATSVINKIIFEQLGAKVELINTDANYGQSINKDCGSTHLEQLAELVKSENLNFGIAYDGDGDRCLMIDNEGQEIDGDQIIAILANYLQLDAIAITVMANQGLLNWAKDNSVHAEITAVGDSNVAEAMRTHAIKIGGEQSGHIILPGEPTGDGILTSLMVAKIASATGKSLHELASVMAKFPQVIVNLDAAPEQKQALKEDPEAKKLLLDYDEKLKSVDGRLLVRPSGTEPLIRITMWGNNKSEIAKLANELKAKLGEIL
ncbi:phosphoglucosamine mutase [Candidatus Saccharibacteria bacterium]|nr:phosphoglucosamine mutase [Candidatus Saccharibacteria bacterium]